MKNELHIQKVNIEKSKIQETFFSNCAQETKHLICNVTKLNHINNFVQNSILGIQQ